MESQNVDQIFDEIRQLRVQYESEVGRVRKAWPPLAHASRTKRLWLFAALALVRPLFVNLFEPRGSEKLLKKNEEDGEASPF